MGAESRSSCLVTDSVYRHISGIRDESGEPRYISPNRKAKLHTYISSQRLNNASRKKLGSGQWLFDNSDYWDFSRPELEPLVEFLKENLE